MQEKQVLYREIQRFRQSWVWLIMIGIAAVMVYAVVEQLVLGRPFGDEPLSDAGLIAMALGVGLGLPALFVSFSLTTEVGADGLYYRFFPIHFSFRRIRFEDLTLCEARTYRPIREYGGWGIRRGPNGKAYNVSGNRGVQLEFRNGERLLIGSRRADELARAIAEAMK